MLTYTLYGDGIHDDTAAIQELIDTSVGELSLPAPKKLYFAMMMEAALFLAIRTVITPSFSERSEESSKGRNCSTLYPSFKETETSFSLAS